MHNHQAQDTETVCEEEAGGDRTEKESIADATGGIHAQELGNVLNKNTHF